MIGLFGLISISAFAQRTRKSAQRVKDSKSSAVFSYGTTDGQIYTNDFLGLKLAVPEDLEILDREIVDVFFNRGKEESKKTTILLMAETPFTDAQPGYHAHLIDASATTVNFKSCGKKQGINND
ncbi:MAG: hypothetical protein ABJA66_21430 [Actinomycetota bacterium]